MKKIIFLQIISIFISSYLFGTSLGKDIVNNVFTEDELKGILLGESLNAILSEEPTIKLDFLNTLLFENMTAFYIKVFNQDELEILSEMSNTEIGRNILRKSISSYPQFKKIQQVVEKELYQDTHNLF